MTATKLSKTNIVSLTRIFEKKYFSVYLKWPNLPNMSG